MSDDFDGNVMFDMTPKLRANVRLLLTTDEQSGPEELTQINAERLAIAFESIARWKSEDERVAATLAPPQSAQPARGRGASGGRPRAAQRNQPRRGGGQSRAQQYGPPLDGEECDVCHGEVGIKPLVGNQSSDSVICLGRCTDENTSGGQDYIHRVRWADEEPMPAGQPDRDDMPF
tara:strand:- start:4634 stop:5161 length:528 start_codon:yes stop_codon:yes gene_type:complete